MLQTRYARLVRRRVYDYCQLLYKQRSKLGYEEFRPMRSFPTKYGKVPAHPTDCSESSALILQASGAPTPYVVKRQGYTGTMLATLPHISKRSTRRGDFAVFVNAQNPTGEHVVILLQGGRWHSDPLCFSHGSPGAYIWPLSTEHHYHESSSIVYLRAVPERLRKA